MRVGIGTCAVLPEPDPDQDLLLEALRNAGHDPALLAWDDPDASDPASFDLVVVRSTWNYPMDPDRFLGWIDRVAASTRLCNPAHIVRWNIDKHYLLELSNRGIRTIPTVYVPRGSAAHVTDVASSRSWGRLVIKPAISASSLLTRAFEPSQFDAAQDFLAETSIDRNMLIQPYMDSVDATGERALIWIGGTWSHAIRKMPRFANDEETVSEASAILDEEQEFGANALACVPDTSRLLYARVDVIRDQEDRLCISELELIEPSLYLTQHPEALDRLVSAIGHETSS